MALDNEFKEQTEKYQAQILGNSDIIKCGIEAASSFGWHRYIGSNGIFIGMESFGASAPAKDLYKHFKITADEVTSQIIQKLQKC